MNSRQFRVSGLSMVIMMVIVLLFVQWISNMDMENVYTYEQFERAVENEEIVSAVIHQAAATPTGTVRLTLRDGTERQVNVPDTVEARELLRQDPGDQHFLHAGAGGESVWLPRSLSSGGCGHGGSDDDVPEPPERRRGRQDDGFRQEPGQNDHPGADSHDL